MLNLRNQKFGRVTALEPTKERQGSSIVWACVCECGAKNILISARDLLHPKRKGCGRCADTEHPLYGIWRGMLQRCADPLEKHYGGRGIKVCKEWQENFLQFVRDVGPRPSKFHSLDRIEVNCNYEPSNVRWATADVQANNKQDLVHGLSDSAILEIYDSKAQTDEMCNKYGISPKTVYNIKANTYSDRAFKLIFERNLARIKAKLAEKVQ